MRNFSHLVEIDAEKRELAIYRIESDGARIFYTSTALPDVDVSASSGIEAFRQFAQMLGENILLDSPAIQQLYEL